MVNETNSGIRVAVFGAVVSLVLFTGAAMLVGYSLTRAFNGTTPIERIHYVLVVGGLGAALVIGWRQYVRITAAGGVLALIGILVTATPATVRPLTSLNIPLTILAGLVVQAAIIEYGVHNPTQIRRVFTRQAVRIGLVVGGLHVVVVLVVRTWLGFYSAAFSASVFRNVTNMGIGVWMVGGAFVTGFVVGVLLARCHLFTPVLTVAGLLAWTSYETWQSVPPGGASVATVGYLLTLYLWGWYVVLVLALTAGLAEVLFRPWDGRPLSGENSI